jgi:hypothetical protein
MEESAHESARRNDHGPGSINHPKARPDAHHLIIFHQNLGCVPLMQIQVNLILQDPLHAELVGFFVALSPWSLDARTLPGIEHSELNPGGIGVPTHDSTQSIDLPDQVAFGQSPNGWIAGHLADGIEILRQDGRLAAESC